MAPGITTRPTTARSLSTQKDIQPSILSFDTREGSADKR